jgi:hypothetical protein
MCDAYRRWWPGGTDPVTLTGTYWPEGLPTSETVEAFVALFKANDFEPCEDGHHEDGWEKIVLYVDGDGLPAHAARELADGSWTSKLGDRADVRHETPAAIACESYGRPTRYFRRRSGRPNPPTPPWDPTNL